MPVSESHLDSHRQTMTQLAVSIIALIVLLLVSLKTYNSQIVAEQRFLGQLSERSGLITTVMARREAFEDGVGLIRCAVLAYMQNRFRFQMEAERNFSFSTWGPALQLIERSDLWFNDDGSCEVSYSYRDGDDVAAMREWEAQVTSLVSWLVPSLLRSDRPLPELSDQVRTEFLVLGLAPSGHDLSDLSGVVDAATTFSALQTGSQEGVVSFLMGSDYPLFGRRLNVGGSGAGAGPRSLFLGSVPNQSLDRESIREALIEIVLKNHPELPSRGDLYALLRSTEMGANASEPTVPIPFTSGSIEPRYVLMLGGLVLVMLYNMFLAKARFLYKYAPSTYLYACAPSLPRLGAEHDPVKGLIINQRLGDGFLIWNLFLIFPVVYFSLALLFRYDFVSFATGGDSEDYFGRAFAGYFLAWSEDDDVIYSDLINLFCLTSSLYICSSIISLDGRQVGPSPDLTYSPLLAALPFLLVAARVLVYVFLSEEYVRYHLTIDYVAALIGSSRIIPILMLPVVWCAAAWASPPTVRIYIILASWLSSLAVFFAGSISAVSIN